MPNNCRDTYLKFHACIFANTYEGSHPYPNEQCRELEKKFLKCERNYKNEKKTSYDYKLFNDYLDTIHDLPVDFRVEK